MLDVRDNHALMADILRASSDCIKVLDLDGTLVFMSEGGQHVMEIDEIDRFIGCPWPDFWQGDGNAAAIRAVELAKAGRPNSFQGQAETGKGRRRWWDVAVSPICDASGAVVQILSISRDITDLKEAQDRQRLLMEELSHRVRNTLTMIKALAGQTLRDVSDRAAVEAFDARLMALAGAHDLLLQENWSSAPIATVVGAALKLHHTPDRFSIGGPDVLLGPKTALSIALLLHELATNATKHGALSSPHGAVDARWDIETGDGPDGFVLRWRETGGPAVAQPDRKGFGSRLINIGLGAGSADIRFEPEGLTGEFRATMEQVGR